MNSITKKKIGEFLDRQEWTFSKTYAAFAPHEYIVKTNLSDDEQEMYVKVAKFMQDHGFHAYFGKKMHVYYEYDGRYYWTMEEDVRDSIVMNRCNISDYVMVKKKY